MISLLIVDDDPIVVESLAMIAEQGSRQAGLERIQLVGRGKNGREAVTLYKQKRPDLLLMDIRMEPVNGLEACREIRQWDPEAKILFLTTFLDDEYIVESLRLGARGYLVKSDVKSLLPAIYAIQKGARVFGDEIAEKIPSLLGEKEESRRKQPAFQDLTDTEWALVEMVADGKTNKEIADALQLSDGTVRNYLSIILDKSGFRNRTQLAIAYYKSGKGDK